MAEDDAGWLAVRHRKRGKAHAPADYPAAAHGLIAYRCGRVAFEDDVEVVRLATIAPVARCGVCWKGIP